MTCREFEEFVTSDRPVETVLPSETAAVAKQMTGDRHYNCMAAVELLTASADHIAATLRPWRKEPDHEGYWWHRRNPSVPAAVRFVDRGYDGTTFNLGADYGSGWEVVGRIGGEWQEVAPAVDAGPTPNIGGK